MKALVSEQAGGPDTLQLREMPDPSPSGETDVVVRVKACGVNFPDVLIIQDQYQYKPIRPFSPGIEFAGVVEAIGSGVGTLKPGDAVGGYVICGAMAEKVLTTVDRLFPLPAGVPFEHAAAMVITYGTALYGLKDRAQLKPGETMLVLGAAGGVGTAAIEIGKAMGARVIAAASSEEKLEVARELGADQTLLYPSGPLDKAQAKAFSDAIKDLSGGNGVDLVYDPVGGDLAEPALRAIAWEGRYLVIGFVGGIARIPSNLPLLKGCSIVGVFWGAWAIRDPATHLAQQAEALGELYRAGKIRPRIGQTVPLERGAEAIATLANRQAVGKLVVVPG